MDYIKSKTKAIREAAKFVSWPVRTGEHSWQVSGPWDASKPNDAHTTRHYTSHRAALDKRSAWLADVALCLMGASSEARYFADYAYSCEKPMTARGLIDYALARCPIMTET